MLYRSVCEVLTPPSHLNSIYNIFSLKDILCCEHVFPDQERYVLCRGINGRAIPSSVPQERALAQLAKVMDL